MGHSVDNGFPRYALRREPLLALMVKDRCDVEEGHEAVL